MVQQRQTCEVLDVDGSGFRERVSVGHNADAHYGAKGPGLQGWMFDLRWAPEDVDHVIEQAIESAPVRDSDAVDLNPGDALPQRLD